MTRKETEIYDSNVVLKNCLNELTHKTMIEAIEQVYPVKKNCYLHKYNEIIEDVVIDLPIDDLGFGEVNATFKGWVERDGVLDVDYDDYDEEFTIIDRVHSTVFDFRGELRLELNGHEIYKTF